jgi:hypothetical protein
MKAITNPIGSSCSADRIFLSSLQACRKDSSVRSRVEKSEANAQATNAVIPPARMPDN